MRRRLTLSNRLRTIHASDEYGVYRFVSVRALPESNGTVYRAQIGFSASPGIAWTPYTGREVYADGATVGKALSELVSFRAPKGKTAVEWWLSLGYPPHSIADKKHNQLVLFSDGVEQYAALTHRCRHTGGNRSLVVPGQYSSLVSVLNKPSTIPLLENLAAYGTAELPREESPELETDCCWLQDSAWVGRVLIPHGDYYEDFGGDNNRRELYTRLRKNRD